MNFPDNLPSFGDATALITEQGAHVSYAQLSRDADAVRAHIPSRCLVFSVSENGRESIAGYLGFLRGRIVPVLIADSIDAALFDNLIQKYKPSYLWAPRHIHQDGMGDVVYSFGSYVLIKTRFVSRYDIHPDLALLMTTSGSTGSPKLVRQSYKNIMSNASSIAAYLGISADDRPITTLPMSYTYGLSIINSHLLKGASIILTNKTLMDKNFWSLLRDHQATTFGGVPYVYEMLKKLRFARMELPSLKILTQAGGKLSPDLSREFAEICEKKGIKFFVMYGQTEATARMSYLPSEYALKKAGSMGIAIPGGEFWIEDDAGRKVDGDEVIGELIYKGDNVTLGYAESCADLSKGDENKGILRTGDMAQRDKDGFYYIVGRKKRFLKLFGSRVNLDELEHLLKAEGHDAACVGTDDHLRIYVTHDRHHEVRSFVVDRIGINQSGFTVVTIDEIPRSESGKVLYSQLSIA